jgi:hypothetical protein
MKKSEGELVVSVGSHAENIRFSRFLMTLLIAIYALLGYIEGMYLMLLVAGSTILMGSGHSLSSYLLKFLALFGFKKLFKLNPRYDRSFNINREMELFEETLRLIVGGLCIFLYWYGFVTISTILAFFMAVMMLISTYFGFCISGLMYIAYRKILGQNSDG